jgi:PAS domain S-box-containing protein
MSGERNDEGSEIVHIKEILNSLVDGVITITEVGSILTMNPAAEKLFGYLESEVVGKNVKILMEEPYQSQHDQYLQNYRETGVRKIIGIGRDVRGLRSDGGTFPLHLAVGESFVGNIRIFTGIIVDLTERKKHEQELVDSKERIESILNTVADGIITINHVGVIETINPAAMRLFGYTESELIGQNVKILMPDNYKKHHDGFLARYVSDRVPHVIGRAQGREIVGEKKDGSTFPLELNVSEMTIHGGKRYFTGILRDITERKQFEGSLSAARIEAECRARTFSGLVDMIPDGIMLLDDSSVVISNTAAATFIGIDHLTGMSIGEVMQVLIEWLGEDVVSLIQSQPKGIAGELNKPIFDSSDRQLQLRWNRFEQSSSQALLIFVADISLNVQMNQAMAAEAASLERERAMSSFLRTMSHEIRTPLNGILAISDMLKTGDEWSSEKQELLDTLSNASNSLNLLVNDILDADKLREGQMHMQVIPFSIPEVLKHVTHLMKPVCDKKGLFLKENIINPESFPPFLLGDPHRLLQVALNLVGNSIKFTGSGGLTMSASIERATGDSVMAIIEVIDTGVGIPINKQQELFREFRQVSDSYQSIEGTGLGLFISRKLVTAMNGTIELISQVGEGTTVTLKLPLAIHLGDESLCSRDISIPSTVLARAFTHEDRSSEQIFSNYVDSTRSSATRCRVTSIEDYSLEEWIVEAKIVIVDDSATNRKVAASLFKSLGASKSNLRFATDGIDALNVFSEGSYDFILMDVNMPRCDGYEASLRIRDIEAKESARQRVIILGYTADAITGPAKYKTFKMDGILIKPVTLLSLRKAIEAAREASTKATSSGRS